MVIGDSDLPAENRWAILRPHGGCPVLAIKETWANHIETLTEALAALPALTADVEGVRRVTIDTRHPGRRDLSYNRKRA